MPKHNKLFEINGWEIIEAAQAARENPPPLCYSRVWLSMNVLMVDPKAVFVEASEIAQIEQLDKLGFEIIPVPFRDPYHLAAVCNVQLRTFAARVPAETTFPNRFVDFE